MNHKYLKIGRMIKDKVQILDFAYREKDYIAINTTDKQIEETLKAYKVTKNDIPYLYDCVDKNAKVHAIQGNTLLRMHDFRAYPMIEDDMLKEIDIVDEVATQVVTENSGVPVIEEVISNDTKDYTEHRTQTGTKYYTKKEKSKVSVIISY